MCIFVERGTNPYRDGVQGEANEPITVTGLLDRAEQVLEIEPLGHSQGEVYDRLEANAARIAIIAGSQDHPAHILDLETALRAAVRIWQRGGIPFLFSIPVMCDGTAQSNLGMCYSLQSRNGISAIVVNQMESHSYHGAFVLSGCDKTPLGIAAGLAHLDVVRQRRGDAPLFATFCTSHVLRGGTIPRALADQLQSIATRARGQGLSDIASDLEHAMAYILQCTTNAMFQGVLTRAEQEGLVSSIQHKEFERELAIHTCDSAGGICAFNGTGNSSRQAISALGLGHPATEFLTEPPTASEVNRVVDDLCTFVNKPAYSVSNMVRANFANTVRVHSATGGSTNLMLHLVAAMLYGGCDVSVWTVDQIRRHPPVPDIFDYSLTEGRDIFALAQQCSAGTIRGTETIFYELVRQGIPMDVDAPTVTGQTWADRLADTTHLSAGGVRENPIVLAAPRRSFSGVDVLRSNLWESAVVKISGMTTEQLADFDEKVSIVVFFENEDEANAHLLDIRLLENLKADQRLARNRLLALASHNSQGTRDELEDLKVLDREALFDRVIADGLLKIAVVISGQGPEAFGMPEMFTPMQHINASRELRKLTVLISDGRYSGVTYGAAIGHVTPEALNGGAIGVLRTGDLLHIWLSHRRIDLIDPDAFESGRVERWVGTLAADREALGIERRQRIIERRRQIAASNRMTAITDAGRGVVPLAIAEEATQVYKPI